MISWTRKSSTGYPLLAASTREVSTGDCRKNKSLRYKINENTYHLDDTVRLRDSAVFPTFNDRIQHIYMPGRWIASLLLAVEKGWMVETMYTQKGRKLYAPVPIARRKHNHENSTINTNTSVGTDTKHRTLRNRMWQAEVFRIYRTDHLFTRRKTRWVGDGLTCLLTVGIMNMKSIHFQSVIIWTGE